MKASQFWILTVCSVIVSFLMIQTVFLKRELDRKQRLVVDSQEAVATTSTYERAWQNLAVKIWTTGNQDPQMMDLLKSEGVNVYRGTPASTNAPSGNPPPGATPVGHAPAPPASSKNPAPAAVAPHASP